VKEIPLTQGKVALVDDEDFPFVSRYKWCVAKRGRNFYAVAQIAKGESVLMHALIMGEKPGCIRDHINGNGLDNRRSNLRFARHAQNMANRSTSKNNKCGFKGVRKHQRCDKFIAEIRKNGKRYYGGLFPTAEDAARAYDALAAKLHGEFARLNFPGGAQ